MSNFNGEALKSMSVEVVSNYTVKGTPLSESIASIAVRQSLNPEQIKRLIEVSNQVAYLKLLETASDRTFEFKVASYPEVMSIIVSPDESMSKEASEKLSPLDLVIDRDPLEKEASEEESFLQSLPKSEKLVWLDRQVHSSKRELEKAADEEHTLLRELLESARDVQDDDLFIEKLAFVTEGDDSFGKIARLVKGEEAVARGDEVFYSEDVEDVHNLFTLFKRAEDLRSFKQDLEQKIEKAEAVLKQAFIPVAAKGVASKVAPTAFEKAKSKVGKAGTRLVKGVEGGFALADNAARSKNDVWKSIRGR